MRVTTIIEIQAPKDYPEEKLGHIHDAVILLEQAGCHKGKLTFEDGVKIKWKPFKTETQKPAETDMQ